MKILRIILCQSESNEYTVHPRSLGWGDQIYDVVSNNDRTFIEMLGRDENRFIHQLREIDAISFICNKINVVLIPDSKFTGPELVDTEYFRYIKKERFVNVYVDPLVFNKSNHLEKRKIIIDSIMKALLLVVDHGGEDVIEKLCADVYEVADDMECLLKTKSTKKYIAQIWFKTKATGYTAILQMKNLQTQMQTRTILFEDKHHAYFLISLHKIEIKGRKCIIYSDPEYAPEDEPIVVDIEV